MTPKLVTYTQNITILAVLNHFIVTTVIPSYCLYIMSSHSSGTSHGGGYSHEAVLCALQECGIRHIDTAKRYGCEEALGKAVVDSGVPREELWLTTKLWPGDYGQSAKQACRDSCAMLGVDYLGKCVT